MGPGAMYLYSILNGPGELPTMKRFQVKVTRTYSDGAYASYATSETWRKDIDALDDGFFKYLVLELAGGEDWLEAIMRAEISLYELEQVSAALRATYLQETREDANVTST
jgi:hypothetical protein